MEVLQMPILRWMWVEDDIWGTWQVKLGDGMMFTVHFLAICVLLMALMMPVSIFCL